MSNVLPIGKFRGGFAIASYSMLTMSPPLDTTDPMKRIDCLWTNFIPSASFLVTPCDITDGFAQVSAQGMSLYQEDDHQRLTTDPTIYTPSSDGRLLGFLLYRTGIAPAFRRDAIIVGLRPLVPQTPSQAAAMQQHQQQMVQQSTIGMPQTMGTPISMQHQMKRLPVALNIPQLRVSFNGGLCPPATPVLTAITPPEQSHLLRLKLPHSHLQCLQLSMAKPVPPQPHLPSTSLKSHCLPLPPLSNKSLRLPPLKH